MQWKVKEESESVVQTSHEKETKRNRRKKGGKRRESSIRTIDIDIIFRVFIMTGSQSLPEAQEPQPQP